MLTKTNNNDKLQEEIRRLKQSLVVLQRQLNATKIENEVLVDWIEHYTGAAYFGIGEYSIRLIRDCNLGINVIRAEDWF